MMSTDLQTQQPKIRSLNGITKCCNNFSTTDSAVIVRELRTRVARQVRDLDQFVFAIVVNVQSHFACMPAGQSSNS